MTDDGGRMTVERRRDQDPGLHCASTTPTQVPQRRTPTSKASPTSPVIA
ncbi:hypothetical protein ACFVTY_39615 [Streptomyces sp. NPDC058067]